MSNKQKTSPKSFSEYRPDPKMLEMLVCPISKTTLEYDGEKNELIARATHLAYPVRDGIPIMIASEARELEDNE